VDLICHIIVNILRYNVIPLVLGILGRVELQVDSFCVEKYLQFVPSVLDLVNAINVKAGSLLFSFDVEFFGKHVVND
jgi:hypothetical protein